MSNSPDRVLSALGLAKRAGKIISGTEQVQDAVRAKKALIVIAARDISENSRKKITNTCTYYETELVEYATMELISAALGQKKLISSVAITDDNFRILIKKQLSADNAEAKND